MKPANGAKTVLGVIQSTTEYLGKHGVESPRLNSEHLVAHALQRKRIELYMEFDRVLLESELIPLRELVRKRAGGEPLQHLLGTVEFCGRTFFSDPRALIPRSETELLAEQLLGMKRPPRQRIIDIGTGTGVIALTLAAEMPEAEILGVDISLDALELARKNAGLLGLADRVVFSQSDLLASAEGDFDIIAANLPYVATDEIPKLAREVRCDPVLALDGGPDGIAVILRLITEAKTRMRPGAVLALEIGQGQTGPVQERLAAENYQDIQIGKDYQGIGRFLFATYG